MLCIFYRKDIKNKIQKLDMRHNLLFIFFICISLNTLYAQLSFSVKGEVAGAAEKSAVSLHFDNPANEAIAKTEITGGKFEMKGTIEEPAIYVLVVDGAKQNLGIFLDGGQIKVKAKIDSMPLAKVSGSALQNEFHSAGTAQRRKTHQRRTSRRTRPRRATGYK
jgi:hypothetical protein